MTQPSEGTWALETVAALARGWFRAHLTDGGAEAVRGKRLEASP